MHGISDVVYNIGFMGMYRDSESELAQNWNRYFDKRSGRYTQPDRIGLDGGPNRYPYANLNPLLFADPTGLKSFILGDSNGPVVIDNGSSCGPLFPPPRVDDNGCITTSGPSICLGPGAIRGASLPVPQVADPKLGNLVRDLYKGASTPNPIGTGSTADAIRGELATGLATGGRFHSQKGDEYARALESWLRKNPNASHYDRLTAETVKNDLLNALGRK